MTTYVKSPNAGNVIGYDGTDFDDPNWTAEEKPFADAGLNQAEYDALPDYDAVGQPWYSEPPTMDTKQYGTTAQRPTLAAHEFYTRYNTTHGKLEIHDGSGWHDVDGNPLA